jgi:hypothetical protein
MILPTQRKDTARLLTELQSNKVYKCLGKLFNSPRPKRINFQLRIPKVIKLENCSSGTGHNMT